MADLIDRAWLLQYGSTKPISEAIPEFRQMSHEEKQGAIKMARGWLRIISKAPAVDPVRHGQWIRKEGHVGEQCSACGNWSIGITCYCPHCGAKMGDVADDG